MKKHSPLDGMIDVAALLPGPVGVGLAVAAYLTLGYFSGRQALPVGAAGMTVLDVLQYLVPVCVLLATGLLLSGRSWGAKVSPELDSPLPDVLEALSRQEFDALVAEAFRREGYMVVERCGKRAEGGVDLELFMGRDRYLVQCRQWQSTRVGVAAVRDLNGVISAERAVGGFIVTSGKFTDEARAFALGRSIRLVPADSLRRMLARGPLSVSGERQSSASYARRRNDPVPPACPQCGKAMMTRRVRHGEQLGKSIWGCTSFPACQGSREM